DQEPSDLEAEAGRRAIQAAGLTPDAIDLLLLYSMVNDRICPANGPAVQQKCELVNAAAWNLDIACASFQPAMVTADALVKAGAFKKILVVCSSAASRILDYDTASSTIFGDGAAAAVFGEVPSGHGLVSQWQRTDGSFREGIVFAPLEGGVPQPRWDRSC